MRAAGESETAEGTRGYVSLEPPDVREAAAADPRGFLGLHSRPLILDEIQHAPGLLPYVKEIVDAHRSRPGQYLLTGSQNLGMSAAVTESLAGRAAVLRLLPLSWREMARDTSRKLPWERSREGLGAGPPRSDRGGLAGVRARHLPRAATHPRRDAELWHASYVQTYLERDVRSIRQVGDLVDFQRFLRAVAARSAQLLDLSDIARDLGVAVNKAKAWLSVLEATYQVFCDRALIPAPAGHPREQLLGPDLAAERARASSRRAPRHSRSARRSASGTSVRSVASGR